MMQPTRLGPRKTVQLLIALTILAWATQTLFAQWGFGQTTAPAAPAAPIVEVRVEATIDGTDVTLKELCRWSDDAAVAEHGDLVVAKLSKESPVKQIGIAQIKSAMEKAGANLSQLQFAGAASCAVRRSEVDDATFARLLEQNGVVEEAAVEEIPVEEAAGAETAQVMPEQVVDVLEPKIEAPAELKPEPKVTVAATKPALRTQLVLTRALSVGQKIIASDVTTQVLTNADDAVAAITNPNDIIGQLTARKMQRGDVLTAQSVKPAPLVTKDQFVTVTIPHEGATIETVARAMEEGIKGQIIKAKNEATGEIYAVIVTASAAGNLTTSIDGDSKDIASTTD